MAGLELHWRLIEGELGPQERHPRNCSTLMQAWLTKLSQNERIQLWLM